MTKLMPRMLVIDDDKEWIDQVPLVLEEECVIESALTIDRGINLIDSQYYDIVLLDLNFKNDQRTGLDVFRTIHAADKGADVIVISGETSHERIVELFNAGVTKFISKPASPNDVRNAVRSVLNQREVRRRALDQIGRDQNGIPLVGESLPMQKLRSELDRVIKGGAKDILLLGETGAGKEVVASLIARSCDPSGRLININCAAISDGLAESELFGHVRGAFTGAEKDRAGAFELAGGGFIFLDEVGDMPLLQQAKLLRVIQERRVQRVGASEEIKVSFRSISATNIDIDTAVAKGKFRQDLLYRIAKDRIYVPSLRDRLEDIPELVHYFLAQASARRRKNISQEALALLQSYHWPGNVRQLRAVIDIIQNRCVDPTIRDRDVCQSLPEVANFASTVLTSALVGKYGANLIVNERKRYETALIQANYNRADAAKIIGVSRATFFRKAKDLGLVTQRKTNTKESALEI